jgi:hypothetical protein
MAAQALLVVVVVRDTGLRSALAAHLSLDGHDLLTASNIGYGLLGSAMIRAPSIVVIEEALIPLDAERWIERQRAAGEWLRLGVLSDAAQSPGEEWCRRFAPRTARRDVPEWVANCARRLPEDLPGDK